jgi:uncharacterized protein
MELDCLTQEDRQMLLALARQGLEQAVLEGDITPPEAEELPPSLRDLGTSFVTLTLPEGALRGCIGGLEIRRPLGIDVFYHAAAAAMEDYRFLPVRPEELPDIQIEVSRLTPPRRLNYDHPDQLPRLLHPHIDGVILYGGPRRATFLPQVWQKLPDPVAFLDHLCEKMGEPPDAWRRKKFTVEVYQVEEIHEK